jgi:hypothetical protein
MEDLQSAYMIHLKRIQEQNDRKNHRQNKVGKCDYEAEPVHPWGVVAHGYTDALIDDVHYVQSVFL